MSTRTLPLPDIFDPEEFPFWSRWFARHLDALLLAADLDGYPLDEVRQWLARRDLTTPLAILDEHRDQVPAGWVQDLRGMAEAPSKIRADLFMMARLELEARQPA